MSYSGETGADKRDLGPEGGIHGFRNDTDAPASILILFAPGIAREAYFLELEKIGRSARPCRRTTGPTCMPATARSWSSSRVTAR